MIFSFFLLFVLLCTDATTEVGYRLFMLLLVNLCCFKLFISTSLIALKTARTVYGIKLTLLIKCIKLMSPHLEFTLMKDHHFLKQIMINSVCGQLLIEELDVLWYN